MKYIGIDLGTTYSCVAMISEGQEKAEPLGDKESGDVFVPSVVSYEGGNIRVGESAKQDLTKNTKNRRIVIDNSKRDMGTNVTYEVTINNDIVPKKPEDIAEDILRWLKNHTSQLCDLDVGSFECIVTVPASYNEKQKMLVKDAAEKAGLGKISTISEPTAAAASYMVDNKKDVEKFTSGYIMVFDLGGGTLDVSLVDIKGKVINTKGFPKLGGKDWDAEIVSDMIRRYRALNNSTVEEISESKKFAMQERAEFIKKQLTDTNEDYVAGEDEKTFDLGGELFNYTLSKKQFNDMTRWRMDLAMDCIDQILEESKKVYSISKEDIVRVLLVGGSSRMDQVEQSIISRYPVFKGKIKKYNPDKAIAIGAAYIVENKRIEVHDIFSHTIGVRLLDENDKPACYNMIYRNTAYATKGLKVEMPNYTHCKTNKVRFIA